MRRFRTAVVCLVGLVIAGGPGYWANDITPSAVVDGPIGAHYWSMPVASFNVTRDFEAPATKYAAGHRGVDLHAEQDTPVYSPADGAVSFAGWVVDRPVMSIQHAGGLVSSLESIDAVVVLDDWVRRGQLVGMVARGTHCESACLHWGVRLHGKYVSPLTLLGLVPRAVLLPLN